MPPSGGIKWAEKNVCCSHRVSPVCLTPGLGMGRDLLVFYAAFYEAYIYFVIYKVKSNIRARSEPRSVPRVPCCPDTDMEMPFLCGWDTPECCCLHES